MRAAVGYSRAEDTSQATDEVLESLSASLGPRADAAVIFATSHHAEDARLVASRLRSRLGSPALIGCSAASVITADGEHEGWPGLGVLALEGARARVGHVADGPEAQRFLAAGPAGLTLALADPRRIDGGLLSTLLAEPLLAGGGIAGAGQAFFSVANDDAGEGLCALSRIDGLSLVLGVTQGAQPHGPFRRITKARRNAVLELDGRPAGVVFRECLAQWFGGEVNLASLGGLLFAALRPEGAGEGRSDYLVRPIVGIDAVSGAILVQEPVEEGQRLAFASRDTVGAMHDLASMLREIQAGLRGPPRAALYFNCMGRGTALHVEQDVDVHAIRRALPNVPLLGMASSFELGPAAGRARLLMYSGVLAVLADS